MANRELGDEAAEASVPEIVPEPCVAAREAQPDGFLRCPEGLDFFAGWAAAPPAGEAADPAPEEVTPPEDVRWDRPLGLLVWPDVWPEPTCPGEPVPGEAEPVPELWSELLPLEPFVLGLPDELLPVEPGLGEPLPDVPLPAGSWPDELLTGAGAAVLGWDDAQLPTATDV